MPCSDQPPTFVRKYQPGEEMRLWELFFHSVRKVAIRDYAAEQVAAWAPDATDEAAWRARIESNHPYVCELDGQIVGFADVQPTGYIDMFFVDYRHQRQGVAKALFEAIDAEAQRSQLPELWSNVSITARPFFESRGFVVVAAQQVVVRGQTLQNFRMARRS